MRRLFAILFACVACTPSSAETLSTPKRYEECLIANGSLISTSEILNIPAAARAAQDRCTYSGPNRMGVIPNATDAAIRAIPEELKRIDSITDRDFVKHASCISTESVNLIKSNVVSGIRRAAQLSVSKCPRFDKYHKHDMWEVLTQAHMEIYQQLEAEADNNYYSERAPSNETTQFISGLDFLVDGRNMIGKRITVNDCNISYASSSSVSCTILSKGSVVGQLMIDSKTSDRDGLRRALERCSGFDKSPACRASVTGTVYDLFDELGVKNSEILGMKDATIHWTSN